MSGFVICITTAQLCARKMKRCIKAHDYAHTPLAGGEKKGGVGWKLFFLLLLANHSVTELITICFLPASENMSIYQSLGSSGLDYSPVILQPLSLGSNALIDFTRQPLADYHLASYPACNCTVLTNAEPQSKQSIEEGVNNFSVICGNSFKSTRRR